jgi:Reverse transcriptase (RNA-dependent DNA polymerase).
MSNGIQTGWRRIFDLSSPTGTSVNEGIEPHFGELKYGTFDAALAELARLGRGTRMLKRDLKAAFRHIPVCAEDHHLLVFEWNGNWYVDMFLPFGLRTAPFIFNLFAEALHWIMEDYHGWVLHHYLDDFIGFFSPDSDLTLAGSQFKNICDQLGFHIADDKNAEGTVVDYLGIIIDSERMEARLPPNKKDRVLLEVTTLLQKGTVNHTDLQSILGFLTFCTRVFPLGRPFLRHLFNMLNGKKQHQRLTLAARRDLEWWKTLLPRWSGISAIAPARNHTMIATDASGKKGIGGVWFATMDMFSTRMPRRHRMKHINYKEMHAVLHAFAEWGENWKGQLVEVLCDNEAVVSGINNKTIRGVAIGPLQHLLLLAAILDVEIRATWISTDDNALADALSRFDLVKVATLTGQESFSPPSRQTSRISQKISQLMQDFTSTTAQPRPQEWPSPGPLPNTANSA